MKSKHKKNHGTEPKLKKRYYRRVWISDTHLCTKDSQAELVYSFLDSIRCDYLYLVGDIIDVWALQKKWYWPQQYNEVLHKLLKRSRRGAKVIFIPGNHDEFFRNFAGYQFGDVEVMQHAYHQTADGRRFLVLHGDEFERWCAITPGCRNSEVLRITISSGSIHW